MFNPISVANFFINKSFYEGVEMTPMKVLKLVYISHGWYMAITDKELITEQTEAWKYGPVIPSVYNVYKSYGRGDISSIDFSVLEYKTDYELLIKDPNMSIFLNKIWDVYKGFSGIELSELTHQEGTPWYIVWNEKGGAVRSGAIIPNALIKEHYKKMLNSSNE